MDLLPQDTRLIKRTFWLIRHRWIAIGFLIVSTFSTKMLIDIEIQDIALYIVALALIIENTFARWILKNVISSNSAGLYKLVKKVINFQISADLIALTFIMHYSGGIENPMYLIYIFHMVIASILLSEIETYIHTSVALLLFGVLVFLEYKEILNHYCLCKKGESGQFLYLNEIYVIRTYGVFLFSSYILVYLSSSIGKRLRNQEDKLSQAIDKLQKQDAIKNEYVLRVTHDIKGNLAAIQTNLSVVTNKILGPIDRKQEEFITRAYDRTLRLTKFVRNLLMLTKMRLQDEIEKEVFDINEIIDSSVKAIEPNADDKLINVVYIKDTDNVTVEANKLSIEEVTTNLLLNAVKYTQEKGTIKIRLDIKQEHVLIEIEDDGMGIPANELSFVFDEFYRGSNVRQIKEDSTGIGLSLVKKIIDRHDGKIWVESKEDEGTVFRFTLPRLK